jgi:hypothetical protein
LDEFTGRFHAGNQYLDELLVSHNRRTHTVVHVNGCEFDYRRHNLRLEDQSETREISLKSEILALVDQSGKSIEQIAAEYVGWRG